MLQDTSENLEFILKKGNEALIAKSPVVGRKMNGKGFYWIRDGSAWLAEEPIKTAISAMQASNAGVVDSTTKKAAKKAAKDARKAGAKKAAGNVPKAGAKKAAGNVPKVAAKKAARKVPKPADKKAAGNTPKAGAKKVARHPLGKS